MTTPEGIDWRQLAEHLARHELDLALDLPAERCSGGLANRNFICTVNGGPVILRCPPAGDLPPGAHDMVREHTILSAIGSHFPLAPKSLHLCKDRSVIGVPFQLIEYRAGMVIRGSNLPSDLTAPDASQRLSRNVIGVIGKLHAVDSVEVGLENFGKPDGFVERAVTGWAKRAAIVGMGSSTRTKCAETIDWLEANVGKVEETAPTILHCDIKLDNLILDPASLAPIALIDWDMGTRGHPLFDLATTLSYWAEPGDPECMRQLGQMPTASPGFLSRDEAAELYAETTGRSLAGLHVLRVLATFKLGVVFCQLHARWKEGALSGEQYRDFGSLGGDLIAFARAIAADKYR